MRITIDPVTRLEGHAKITIDLNEAGEVADAIQRPLEILPGGRTVEITSSGTLAAEARALRETGESPGPLADSAVMAGGPLRQRESR